MPRSLAALAALTLLGPAAARSIDLADTRLVADPATSGTLVAFAYANDLWVASSDGTGVRRLTSHPGVESGPRFSPDGRLIAFTGRYEGNTDVYVVEATGGVPKRLTYHPGNDIALEFTPDGDRLAPRIHLKPFAQRGRSSTRSAAMPRGSRRDAPAAGSKRCR